MLPAAGVLRYLDHVEEEGEVLYQQVQKLGLEGIVAKEADSPYKAAGRPPGSRSEPGAPTISWWSDSPRPKGVASGFGALHLGDLPTMASFDLHRAGRQRLHRKAACRGPEDSAVAPSQGCRRVPGRCLRATATRGWRPELVCEVEYTERTEEGLLRQPVFLRFRDDKKPEECVAGGDDGMRGSGDVEPEPRRNPARVKTTSREERSDRSARAGTEFTNLKKVFWPQEGYTKGDLIEYYRDDVAVDPAVSHRPAGGADPLSRRDRRKVVLQEGCAGLRSRVDSNRADAGASRPSARSTISSCDDEASLLYLVNLGTIPLHIWGSRTGDIEHPDWCVLDLDPKGAPFTDVVSVAEVAHALCEEIGLPCLVKTSGSSGLHLMIPLGGQCLHDHAAHSG